MEDFKTFLYIVGAVQAIIIGGLVPVVVWLVRMEARISDNSARLDRADFHESQTVKDRDRYRSGVWKRLEYFGEKITLLVNFRETMNQVIGPEELRKHHDGRARFEERITAEVEFLRRDVDCHKRDFRAHLKSLHIPGVNPMPPVKD